MLHFRVPTLESSVSIHPRVSRGRTVFQKVNTMRKRNPDVTARKIAAIEAHLERHPNDGVSMSHVSLLRGRK